MENYYRILSHEMGDNSAEFNIELMEECPVYAGHFPGNAIAPGACNIEMVRECASVAISQEIRFSEIKLCKFTKLLRPGDRLTVTLKWDGDRLKSTITTGGEQAAQINAVIR